MVTSSPISLATPLSQWMIAPSWTLTRWPMRTGATSPRTTVLNQKLLSSPTLTSPTTVALWARKNPTAVFVKRLMRRDCSRDSSLAMRAPSFGYHGRGRLGDVASADSGVLGLGIVRLNHHRALRVAGRHLR